MKINNVRRGQGPGGRRFASAAERALHLKFVEYRQISERFLEEENLYLQDVLRSTMGELVSAFSLPNRKIRLYGRIKSGDSISCKMATCQLGISDVMDIVGIRIITQNRKECYRFADVICRKFKLSKPRYVDYIEAPKANGYQSIHISVIALHGFPVEIQIRTQEMQDSCERGPAAHDLYKKNGDMGRR